ncbi:hypothetical protein VTK73DRAFT_8662 [Phialemonium thermophilum]|uniref:Uncharacterized protein n=1 Tax=Phialemonium thermophilum TaxID=223376 RepID=A0ABR3XN02_9PEZI
MEKQTWIPSMAAKYENLLPSHRRPGEPDRYRLVPSVNTRENRMSWVEERHFWFGTRYVSGCATGLSRDHPHVFKLQIRPSRVAALIQFCASLLPSCVRARVETALPEWFLPPCVVVKRQKRAEHYDDEMIMAELFDTEIEAYKQLVPLQGLVIPVYYGYVWYNGARALVLQCLDGASLSSPVGALSTAKDFGIHVGGLLPSPIRFRGAS